MARLELLTHKEFSPELAGQTVGWTAVKEKSIEGSDPIYVATIIGAIVGENGAKAGYYEYELENGKEIGTSSISAEGFLAISGLSAVITKDEGHVEGGGIAFQNTKIDQEGKSSSHLLINGLSATHGIDLEFDDQKWGNNPQEIIAGLHDNLSMYDLDQHYQKLYYLYNQFLGSIILAKIDGLESNHQNRPFIPDAQQIQSTLNQLDTADSVLKFIQTEYGEDETMRDILGVYSKTTAQQFEDYFVKSRRRVFEAEQQANEFANKLVNPDMTLMPIGDRLYGRSWPYMDAASADENEHFGIELKELKEGKPDRAIHEVNAELRELAHRNEYASDSIKTLELLSKAEKKQAGLISFS